MSSGRSCNWVFTLNNPSAGDLDRLLGVSTRYCIIGEEVGDVTGTPHLQGYMAFSSLKGLTGVRKLEPRAHWDVAKGDAAANQAYCSKGGTFHERGEMPMSQLQKGLGEKARWKEVISLSESGDWEQIKEKHPSVYVNSLSKLQLINKKRPRSLETLDGDTNHEWFVGPPGSGKSKTAREENPGAYIKDPSVKWWDGYNGEDVVIIDDFDKYQVKQGGDMKRWMDRYPFQAEFKGGYELIRPKKVIVTSNYTPAEIWDDVQTQLAILRRVKTRIFGEATPASPWAIGYIKN